MVFYRKYRPQTITELDSSKVRTDLTAILRKNSVHAFLFTGPKGLGKTSTARIVAKAVNCKEKKNGEVEPCNVCPQCQSITDGNNLDVLEIDAASNRGIDEIRDLKEKINLAPLNAVKKVYIIDEVHMLTTEAFNALLKTLEEPPSHALFILCTTEEHKVPATILSRCFHIAFSPATKDELVRSFSRIAKGEGLIVDEETLGIIAGLSDKGFRDGAKIMEELAVIAKELKITRELVEERYKSASIHEAIEYLLESLTKRDIKKSLTIISEYITQGVDIQYFTTQLLSRLHELLLIKSGVVTGKDLQIVSLNDIQLLLPLVSKTVQDIKYAVIPSLPLELAVVEWCIAVKTPHFISTNESTQEKKNVVIKEEKLNEEITVTTLRKEVGNMAKKIALYGEEKKITLPKEDVEPSSVSILNFSAEGEITPQWLEAFWKCLISEMKAHNHTLAGVLRGCMIRSFDREKLYIETPYKFHKEKLDETKTMHALENICKTLMGKTVVVAIVLKDEK